jgi:hypothetical protein
VALPTAGLDAGDAMTAWRKVDKVPCDDPLPRLLDLARNHRLNQFAAGQDVIEGAQPCRRSPRPG